MKMQKYVCVCFCIFDQVDLIYLHKVSSFRKLKGNLQIVTLITKGISLSGTFFNERVNGVCRYDSQYIYYKSCSFWGVA